MSKTKSKVAKGVEKAEKAVDKTLSKVKNAGVTKATQSPKAKSKQIAREIAAKEEKSQKKKKREPTPSSSDDSDSDEEESSSSESESEEEQPAKKAVTKDDKKAKAAESSSDSSDSSDSSESDSSDEESDSDKEMEDADSSESESEEEKNAEKPAQVKKDAKQAVASEESSDSESHSDEEDEEAPAKVAKVAKESSDEESDDSDESEEDASSDSSDSSDESDSESESASEEAEQTEAPSKKRKAEEESAIISKKSKNTEQTSGESANLFIGNLSWNVDEEWLRQEFEEFGELAGVRIVTDRDSGRSRGFGYVEYTDAADAAKAYAAKKDTEIDGRKINLDYASGRQSNNQQGGSNERAQARARTFGDQASPESDTLFVGNIPFSANEDSIRELFAEKGSILGIRLPTDPDSGRPKGFGYVQFSSIEEARVAYNDLNGADLNGRPVRLDFSSPRPNNGGDSRGGRGGGFRGGGRGGGDRGGRGGGFGRGGGRGGGFGRGGRGGQSGGFNKNRGSIPEYQGKKVTF